MPKIIETFPPEADVFSKRPEVRGIQFGAEMGDSGMADALTLVAALGDLASSRATESAVDHYLKGGSAKAQYPFDKTPVHTVLTIQKAVLNNLPPTLSADDPAPGVFTLIWSDANTERRNWIAGLTTASNEKILRDGVAIASGSTTTGALLLKSSRDRRFLSDDGLTSLTRLDQIKDLLQVPVKKSKQRYQHENSLNRTWEENYSPYNLGKSLDSKDF